MTIISTFLKRIITIICFVSLFTTGFSQSITIKAKLLSKTGNPLKNVFVSIDETTSESDNEGNISIAVNPSSFYQISFIGYSINDTVITILNKDLKKTNIFYLSNAAWSESIDKVVVTGNKSKIKLSRTPASIETLPKNIIKNINALDGADILNRVPSVAVVDGQVNIRSGSGWSYGAGSRAAVLLDGLPLISAEASRAQWSFVPMEILNNVEVLKGSSGVLYGSSALNGIVNLITQKPGRKSGIDMSVYNGVYTVPKKYSWTNSNLMRRGASLVANKPFKNGGIITNFNVTDDEGFRMGDYNERVRLGTHIFHQTKINKSLRLNYGLRAMGQTGNSASFLLWHSYDSPYVPLDSNVRNAKNDKYLIDPYISLNTPKTNQSLKMRIMGVKNDIEQIRNDPSQDNKSTMIHTEYGVKFNKLPDSLILNTGIGHTEMRSNSDLTVSKHAIQESFSFIQIEQKLKRTYWQIGLKYARYKNDNNLFLVPITRAGFSYKLSKSDHLRISAGSGYRFPSIAELYTKTTAGTTNIFPSPDLLPEKGNNLEIGYRKFIKTKKIGLMFDMAIYRMYFDNMTEFTFGKWAGNQRFGNFSEFGFTSINVGETIIQGIDLSLKGKVKLRNKANLKFIMGFDHSDPQPVNPEQIYGIDSALIGKSFNSTSSNSNPKYLKYRFLNQAKADFEYDNKRIIAGISFRGLTGFTNVDKDFTEGVIALNIPGIGKALEEAQGWNWVIDYRLGFQINPALKLSLIHTNVANNIFMIRPADLNSPGLIMLKMDVQLK